MNTTSPSTRRALFGICLLLLLGAACPSASPLVDAGAVSDQTPPDGGNTDKQGSCPPGFSLCAGECVHLSYDPDHCGSCQERCVSPSGGESACVDGRCIAACDVGLTRCGDACVDTRSDIGHCGRCGNSCEETDGIDTECRQGACVFSCAATDQLCQGRCVRVIDDVENCGTCGQRCSAPVGGDVSCADFGCVPSCPFPQEVCDDACIDVQSDEQHCGACGHNCDAGTVCIDGRCTGFAPPQVDSLTPQQVHGDLETFVWVTGTHLGRIARAALSRDNTEIPLPSFFTEGNLLRLRLPRDLVPGFYALVLENDSGVSRFDEAIEVVSGTLQIEVIQAGQGDAQIVRGPTGITLLIDGSIRSIGDTELRPRFSTAPDYVVVTHTDADHLGGVYNLLAGEDLQPNTADDVDPGILLLDHGDNHSCGSQLCYDYFLLRDRLEAEGKARQIEPGEVIDLGPGARATCLVVNGRFADGPRQITSRENENSVGLMIEFGSFRYATAGDVTGGAIAGCNAALVGDFADVETPLARLTGPLDVLKVAHHGSCTATPLGYSAFSKPQAALISVGQNNSYCHPAFRVTQNLMHLGTQLFLTHPGITDPNNASDCSVTSLPPTTAPTFGDLFVDVEGKGEFVVRAEPTLQSPPGSGGFSQRFSTWREGHAWSHAFIDTNDSAFAHVMTDTERVATDEELVVTFSAPLLSPLAYLLDDAELTDGLLSAIDAAERPWNALPIQTSIVGNELRVLPSQSMMPSRSYALILPPESTGQARSRVVRFQTRPAFAPGATIELQELPMTSTGMLLDASRLRLRFSRPMDPISVLSSPATVYLEEEEEGLEVILGELSLDDSGQHAEILLDPRPRFGPRGESCRSFCPGYRYALRVTSDAQDQRLIPVDTASLPTLQAGQCSDAQPPRAEPVSTRILDRTVRFTLRADEPLTGTLRVAPASTFDQICGTPVSPECLQIPLRVGTCAADACAPAAGACAHYATATSLDIPQSYRFSLDATDALGQAIDTQQGQVDLVSGGHALLIDEILVDSSSNPESEGEFIEIVNGGSAVTNLCRFQIGKARSADSLRPLCEEGPVWLGPQERALIVGQNFCATATASCTPTLDVPSATLLVRLSTQTLLGGLSNSTPSPLYLVDDVGEVQSSAPALAVCPEDQAQQRVEPYAPDDSPFFSCVPPSPGR